MSRLLIAFRKRPSSPCCCRCLVWMSRRLCVCPGWPVLTKERGSPPRGLAQETEESLDAWRRRFSPSKFVSFVLFNYSQTPLVTLTLSLPRFFLRVWWWVVLAGFHSGRLWPRVTSGQTLRDQEGRATSWSQRTEVHSHESRKDLLNLEQQLRY